jgi:phage terminase small subunit
MTEAQKIQKAPDEKERLKAAELLGKRYGLYTDKQEVTGAVPVVITGEDELED